MMVCVNVLQGTLVLLLLFVAAVVLEIEAKASHMLGIMVSFSCQFDISMK